MLRETVDETAVHAEATARWVPRPREQPAVDWRTVDRALRAIRTRRATLDVEEARWLREAEALQIWRPLGMVSVLDYLERVLGYSPRTAQDRLRVARALGDLPRLTAALAADELPYSAVRELTRVATPTTEASWIAAAAGKNLREIEELVADHRPGDRPDDPPDPGARTQVVRFELEAETFAILRQARRVLDDEHGTNLTDDGFVAALCGAVLDDGPAAETTGRAKFQIALTVCRRCGQGWQEGAGAQIAVAPAAVERARCDAQHIGSIDGDGPERAYQDIPPSIARFVWRRDGGRCRVPGCRSSRGLELHHLVHRADGGSHDATNLALVCSACHLAHHRGALTISGTAEHLVVHRPGQPAASEPVADHPATAASRRSLPGMPPSTSTDAHVGAACARPIGAAADAHVGAACARPIGAAADAHVGAACARPTGAAADAHVGAACARPIGAAAGAHVGAACARPIGAAAGAHVGAACARPIGAAADAHVGAACARPIGAAADAHVGAASKLDTAILCTQAKAALTGLGWKPAIAQAAVVAAAAVPGSSATLERLILESLRRCPTPKA